MNGSSGRVRSPDLQLLVNRMSDFNVHDVEALAQKLYEASAPEGTPWAERSLVVRDPWLAVARKRLLAAVTPGT